MNKDSSEVVKHYDKCQRFGQTITSLPEELSLVSSPWPSTQWGVNLVGLMLTRKGGCKFVVVVVDYFTKWAEVEALASITTWNIRNFLWKSIVCRYSIPHAFIINNEKQFDCEPFHIQNYLSSLGHPQANNQVGAMNKTFMKTLKKKLEDKKGAWVDYLPEVLWSYRTTIQTPTGETPFSQAFGSEAVIPVEVGSVSFHVKHYNPDMNDEGIRLSLDMLSKRI
jgi:hypothetical protein